MLDYFALINEYYQPGTRAYKIFVVHAILVTNKALAIARKLGLSEKEQQFIEEAAMLHDLGVFKVNSPKMDCVGELPYICHGIIGQEILLKHELPRHASVAANHVGVGFTKEEIVSRELPLPHQDLLPTNLAEEIITYADMFFSKREATLWQEDSVAEVEKDIASFPSANDRMLQTFRDWFRRFEHELV
jgi:uncharacterized protein